MTEPLLGDVVVHHVCISVGDRDQAIEWWGALFGFEKEFTFEIGHIGAKGAFLRKGPLRLEIFEIAGSEPTPVSRLRPDTDLRVQGVKHFCFAVDDVQASVEKLFSQGVHIAGIARGVGKPMQAEEDPTLREGMQPATAFFITDPWGCLVEILGRRDFPD
jgi:methylmalonyl-CoA/ethylmalonyl-CoA epimerase